MALFEKQDLYVAGTGGYARYRIPALLTTQMGTVLAFCEARKYSSSDTDQIDLFLRRSMDGGRTFADPQVVVSQEGWTCGNPAPLLDRDTGTIWLLFCKNMRTGPYELILAGKAPRTVWVTSSTDDGETWDEPREITDSVKPSGWTWYATGPCHAIQMSNGRFVVPCDHRLFVPGNPGYSHIIFSDDHGRTWSVGGIADLGTNESTALETTDGWLYLNCRNERRPDSSGNHRAVAWSKDGGSTLCPIVHDAALPEPICQGSVCRLTDRNTHGKDRVLFSNPASLEKRCMMTVKLSYDECRTWPLSRVVYEQDAGYSDLCITPEMNICLLYERLTERRAITLARFDLEWLTMGADGL